MKYVAKKNKVLVGFREKSKRYLADIKECLVLYPSVGKKINLLSDLIQSLDHFASIAQIEVAIGDEDTALIFRHLEPLNLKDRNLLKTFAEQNHFHLYLQGNNPSPLEKLTPPDNLFELTYTLPEYDLEFIFHPLDFTQVNLQMNRLMVKQTLSLLDLKACDVVLDLFCGLGNFSLPIAKYAHQVIGVEGNLEMIMRAKRMQCIIKLEMLISFVQT